MKANQAFKANDEAVSPVIGVILMVAITVVLAAVVFVLVSNLSKGANTASPQIAFTKDEQGSTPGGTLTVVSVTNGPVLLKNVVLGGTAVAANGQNCKINNVLIGTNKALEGTGGAGTATLKAGDQITCGAGGTPAATGIGTITISETGTNTLLYTGDFQ
ncbi:MAG TPA: type IV pilin [Candidatus Thermoplasmatota archaeon]|nr:type IV pilin [Candidatus Thermoplasmatota archaeon]